VRVPSGLTQVTLADPAGNESQLEVRGGVAIVPQPSAPGFYLISFGGARPGVVLSVVNLTSAAESNLRPTSTKAQVAGAVPVARTSRVLEAPGDWGFLAAAVALLAIVVQVVWLTRRPRRVDSESIRPLRPERRGSA
jgi:hypothetical protein